VGLNKAAWRVDSVFRTCSVNFEQALYERMLEPDLDILDELVAAEIQSETAKHYEGPQADQKQLQLVETAGIPTGVAPDIHRQVELRKAKRCRAG